MMEEDHDNLLSGHFEQAEQIDNDFIPNSAKPLCPLCFQPCDPLQNYCNNCNSNEVINPLASYMPFVRIRFNIGMYCKIWRKIFNDKDAPIIQRLFYLFAFILIAVMLFTFGFRLFWKVLLNQWFHSSFWVFFWV